MRTWNTQDRFDLTEAADQQRLYVLAEELLARPPAPLREDAPLELELAAKIAESRRFLASSDAVLEIAVVFAMWGEQNRLRPKSAENPNGEDLLRVKLRQLEWATRDTRIRWRIYAVDDGCPHGSGRIAAGIAADHPLEDRVRVLFLSDVLPSASGALAPLRSADDSQKAGAVILGCMTAIDDGADVVVYTDADLSVHLGQLGLLLRPHLEDGASVVLGDRKRPGAVLVKQEGRWGIGIKLLRHMQRRIGETIFTRGIGDTQAAFKLYERRILERILEKPTVYDFSFDTDWLAATIAFDEPIECVPFAFVDSFEESASITQGPMTTWFALLKGLTAAVRARGVPHDEEMARVLDEEIASSADLDLLIDHLPPELENATDVQLGQPGLMSARAVRAWIRKRRRASEVAD